MTIQQCKYVLEIHRQGSFNEAAKELFVAQSSLSASIKQLEDELGIKIFDRSKNGTVLTVDGAEFLRYANELVTKNDYIMRRYKNAEVDSRLYISTQHYDFIADIFCKFVTEMSDSQYTLSLQEKETYEVIRDVEIAYSDVGIVAIKNEDADIMSRYLHNKNISFVPLLKVSPHLFVRRDHPLVSAPSLHREALANYPYLSYEQGAHSDSWFLEEMPVENHSDKQIMISDRATLMNVLLKTDAYTVGTGIMPSSLNEGKIVSIPIKSTLFYEVGYLIRKNRNISPILERFLTKLQEFSTSISAF